MDKLPNELPNLSLLSHAEVRRLSARVAELEARLSNSLRSQLRAANPDGVASIRNQGDEVNVLLVFGR